MPGPVHPSGRFKREVAGALGGAAVADVAVMGSVPAHGARTPLIVSGAGSSVAAEAFRELGAAVEDLGGEPGRPPRASWCGAGG